MKNKCTTIIFILFIAIFFIISVVKKDTGFADTENRVLEQKPEFSMESLIEGMYTNSYQNYVRDQFPFRNEFVSMRNYIEKFMMKKEINGVLVCEDDYYIESHKRENYTDEQAVKNVNELETFVEKYSSMDTIKSISVEIVPTAQTVMTNKMTGTMYAFDQNEYISEIADETGECFVDTFSVLKEHDDEYIYYKTDHHWTTYGAYLVYKEWATKNNLNPVEMEQIDVKTVTKDFLGTINNKLNLKMSTDTIESYVVKDMNLTVSYNLSDEIKETVFEESFLEKKDKYGYFFGGNPGVVSITNNEESKENNNDRNLLIIKDSYANCISNVYAANFENTYVVDLRYFNMSIEEFISEYQITDILVLYNVDSFATDTKIKRINR